MTVREPQLAPSILSANFSRLGEDVEKVAPYAGRIHVDVMDGHFVPNLSMGPIVVQSLRPVTDLPLEVHLMVSEPEKFVDAFVSAGADRLIFHSEVVADPVSFARKVRDAGCSPGLAVNPETSWEAAEPFLGEIDLVLLMTVNPGFGGQGFIESVLPKVEEANRSVTEADNPVDIEVDGGVDAFTAARARRSGANVFVAGHAIFRADDPVRACRQLRAAIGLEES